MPVPRVRTHAAIALALLVLPTPARGQVLVGYLFGELLSTPTFNIGFEVGVNFATFDGLDGARRTNSPVFGLFADWRFSEHVHLAGAVLPIAGRGADGITPALTGDPEIDGQTAGGTMARTLSYVEIPVLLKWAPRRETGFRIGAGPSLGIITGATDRYTAVTTDGAPYVLERDIEGQVPGLDVGLSVDVEWRLPILAIAARYTHGLTDIRQAGAATAVSSRLLTGTGRIYLGRKPASAAPPPP